MQDGFDSIQALHHDTCLCFKTVCKFMKDDLDPMMIGYYQEFKHSDLHLWDVTWQCQEQVFLEQILTDATVLEYIA